MAIEDAASQRNQGNSLTAEVPPPSPWLTRPEMAERLRVTVSTLASWASSGIGPRYARFGKYARYRMSDVIAWEEAQLAGGESA